MQEPSRDDTVPFDRVLPPPGATRDDTVPFERVLPPPGAASTQDVALRLTAGSTQDAVLPPLSATRDDPGASARRELVLAPGRRLGGYEVVRELARGGMGAVCVARCVETARHVALKVMLPGKNQRRFLLEARAVARLRHPNLVAVHEVGECEVGAFMALDLVQGESLADRLARDGPLPVEDAARLARDVARALHHAHERGVLHRDVKPANVLVDQAGVPYVADFGLAKLADGTQALTASGQIVGSPLYMSPEQARGDGDRLDARTDVYSLGATLYELLTGRPPFVEASLVPLLRAVVNDDPVRPSLVRSAVPADLEAIVLRCLAKEPEGRYAGCGALAEELDRLLHDEPVQARRPGAPERLARAARRHRRGLIVAAAAPIVLVIALASAAVSAAQRRAARRDLALRALAAVVTSASPDAARVEAAQAALDAAAAWSELDAGAARTARVEAALALGDLARRAGDLGRAREAYAVAAGAGDAPAAEASRWCEAARRAVEAVERQDGAAALRALDAAIAARPAWAAPLLLARARLMSALGDPGAAVACLERAAALDPDNAGLLVVVAEALATRGDLARARPLVERLADLQPGAPVLRVAAARAALARGDAGGARAELEALLSRPDCGAQACRWAGATFLALGDYPRGLAALERAVSLDGSAESQVALGRALLLAGEDRAVDVARAAVARFPARADARLLRLAAGFEVERERGPAVLEELEGLIARYPALPEAFVTRAFLRLQRHQLAGAADDAERAVELDPVSDVARYVRARVRLERGDLAGAEDDLATVLARAPGDPQALAIQALVRARRGDLAGALARSARAVELLPRHAELRAGHAALLAQRGEAARALEELQAAVSLDPSDPRVLLGRAAVLLTLGGAERMELALEDCDRAVALDPSFADAYALRGQARLVGGDARGLADLERFLELAEPEDPNRLTIRALLDMARRRRR